MVELDRADATRGDAQVGITRPVGVDLAIAGNGLRGGRELRRGVIEAGEPVLTIDDVGQVGVEAPTGHVVRPLHDLATRGHELRVGVGVAEPVQEPSSRRPDLVGPVDVEQRPRRREGVVALVLDGDLHAVPSHLRRFEGGGLPTRHHARVHLEAGDRGGRVGVVGTVAHVINRRGDVHGLVGRIGGPPVSASEVTNLVGVVLERDLKVRGSGPLGVLRVALRGGVLVEVGRCRCSSLRPSPPW